MKIRLLTSKIIKNLLLILLTIFMFSFNSQVKKETKQKVKIKCNIVVAKYSRSSDLYFGNNEHYRVENKKLLKKWSQDSQVLKVKSITFSQFKDIPEKYSVFKNVEKLVIKGSHQSINGLDIFPKLKHIEFFDSTLSLNNEKWLNKLEILKTEKTRIKGLKSFKVMPNLKAIYMAYSEFKSFPKDLDKLTCLQEITLGAYIGKVDLSKLNLSKNKYLRKAKFITWYDKFLGIPTGVLKSNIKEFEVKHKHLTKKDKKKLKEIKRYLKKKR